MYQYGQLEHFHMTLALSSVWIGALCALACSHHLV